MYLQQTLDVVAEAGRRAASLADDVAVAVKEGQSNNRIEEILASALLEMMRLERDKCAMIAEHRADLWETAIERDPLSPTSTHAINEARERHREATIIADAIRFDHATRDG